MHPQCIQLPLPLSAKQRNNLGQFTSARRPLAERFWEKVLIPPDEDACWLWTGARWKSGYGAINAGGTMGRVLCAHRVAYELAYGELPTELDVCHTCDVPACVRPDHLFLGTASDNAHDMATKGRGGFQRHPERALRGEQNKAAKLTAIQVQRIRELGTTGVPQRTIAQQFGVTQPNVKEILKRRTWTHI